MKRLFSTPNRQNCKWDKPTKSFKVFHIRHYFSWSSRDSGSWRISSLNWRDQFPCSQKTLFLDITKSHMALDITRPYNLLVSENTSKLKTKPSTVKAPQNTHWIKIIWLLEFFISFKRHCPSTISQSCAHIFVRLLLTRHSYHLRSWNTLG